jgi:hypothetical protein
LRSLGYRVHLHDIPAAAISNALRRHLQLSVDGDWLAAYPDPSSYIPQFFGCGGGNSIWRERRLPSPRGGGAEPGSGRPGV